MKSIPFDQKPETDILSLLPKVSPGWMFIGLGALLLIGAILRWKWVLDMTGQRSAHPWGFLTLLQDWFGESGVRVGMIILSSIVILCGIVFVVCSE